MVPNAEHSMLTGMLVVVPAMINYYNAINLKCALRVRVRVCAFVL